MLYNNRNQTRRRMRRCVVQQLERRELLAADIGWLSSANGEEAVFASEAESLRPKDLLIYYSFPSSINATFNVPGAASEFGQYDYVVLGDCLEFDGSTPGGTCNDGSSELYEHPDHRNTVDIVSHANASSTFFFGYIDLGVITQNLSLGEIQQRVDLWASAGVDGIFFDDFGYDFEVSRQRQNDAVGYVHSLEMPVFANGFRPGDVLGDAVDAVYNPSGAPTELDDSDFYLFESFQVREGNVVPESEWLNRVSELEPFRSPNNVGIQVMAITTNDDENTFDQPEFDYAWHSALLSGYEGFGWGEYNFSAVTAEAPFRSRPVFDPGEMFLGAVENSSPIHTRDTNLGRVVIDTLSVDAGFNSLDFGDAPAPYPTKSSSNGARHIIGGPRLGGIDFESDGFPTTDADGDNIDNQNDEDGVLFSGIGVKESMAALNLSLENTASAKADAWIDFNRDGDWDDAGEKILDDVLITNSLQTLNFLLPSGLTVGDTYARVRVSSTGGLGSTGLASDGEVEDYLVSVVEPAQVESVTINNGNPQRSSVDQVRVTFNQVVDLDLTGGDVFRFVNTDFGYAVVDVPVIDDSSGKTVVEFTFAPGVSVNSAGGLLDGRYELTIDDDLVSNLALALDGDESGNVGGDFTFGAEPHDGFFRKYGDQNGDDQVSLSDFAVFRATFGSQEGDADFLDELDANIDGQIGLADFATFRSNFGT